jgi:valyl-tRNA synthetase
VVVARWPGEIAMGAPGQLGALPADPAAETEIAALVRLVTEVRRFRSDQGLRPSQRVPARLAGIEATALAPHEASIRTLLRLAPPGSAFAPTGTVHAEGVAIELDTAASLDVEAERARLAKTLAATQAELEAALRKLGNPSFVDRAPAQIVAKNRERAATAQREVERLTERIAALP